MPAATRYQPNDYTLREAADQELRLRRTAYQSAVAYFEGRHRRHLSVRPGESDDNIVINLYKQAVDRTVSFLVPQMPILQTASGLEADSALSELWRINGGARTLAKLALHGALSGHCFARILPPHMAGESPRVVALNPANVLVFWRADDYEQVAWYEIHWQSGRNLHRQVIAPDGAQWRIEDWCDDGSGWRQQAVSAWEYPLAPICDWQHNLAPHGYYGVPEVSNPALNDRINKVMSDISRILRFHAAPRTIGIGFQADDVTASGIGNLWTIQNTDAKVFNLEMQSDLAASMNAADYLTRAFMAEQRVVVQRGDVTDWQRITNLGIQALYLDMTHKIAALQRSYEIGVVGISQRLRMLAGDAAYAEPIRVLWPNPLPSSDLEAVSVLEKEIGLGILSRESAAQLRGREDLPLAVVDYPKLR